MEKYANFKDEYPALISLDQLCKICRIAKRSGRYLLEHEIIPAIDTGMKTWRYKIAIDDVITYLHRREQIGSMIPPNAVSSRKGSGSNQLPGTRKCFYRIVEQGEERLVAEYFAYIYSDCEDLLTTAHIADMTGLNKSTVLKLAKSGVLRSIASTPMYLIPKSYLLEFVTTNRRWTGICQFESLTF